MRSPGRPAQIDQARRGRCREEAVWDLGERRQSTPRGVGLVTVPGRGGCRIGAR